MLANNINENITHISHKLEYALPEAFPLSTLATCVGCAGVRIAVGSGVFRVRNGVICAAWIAGETFN